MARAAPDLHGKDIPSAGGPELVWFLPNQKVILWTKAGGELSASKKTAIRQVLVLYSQAPVELFVSSFLFGPGFGQVARPQNPGSQEAQIGCFQYLPTTIGIVCWRQVIFRASFCRFILDSNLVDPLVSDFVSSPLWEVVFQGHT